MRPVDVILPVAGAAADLSRCVDSLIAVGGLAGHRLVMVLDGPQEEAVHAAVGRLRAAPGLELELLANPIRRGFVASVNRGMAASVRDVVLLNSDTIVTAGWLSKLQAAASSSPRIATATPFSNNATLCSLPEPFADNVLPAGQSVASFGELIEGVSERTYPRLPTGVGFCLYITREALEQVGLFDEAAFGLGYGEEVDFCRRALGLGFEHVLDDATFIYHAGQKSFGKSRARRVAAGDALLTRRHPSFFPDLAQWMRQDPVRPARERVVRALLPRHTAPRRDPLRILHVVHGWPPYNFAGTEGYARSLALNQAATHDIGVMSRVGELERTTGSTIELFDHGVRVTLLVNNFDQKNPLARNALHSRNQSAHLATLLDRIRPALVHVHHLAGHSLALTGELERRALPYLLHLHDWWLLCGRANLLDRHGKSCSGPEFVKCAECLPMTRLRPARVWSTLLHAGRRVLAERAIAGAAALVVGSTTAAASIGSMTVLPRDRVRLVPYGIDLPPNRPRSPKEPPAGRPLRCGVIGSLQAHKGIHVALAAFRGLSAESATLEVWGDPAADPTYFRELTELAAQAPVTFRGRFDEARKTETLAALDVLIVPSLGLESFGLVAYEAIACGTPVLLSPRGALAELAGRLPAEASFPPGDAGMLRRRIELLLADPGLLVTWSRQLPLVRTFAEHAADLEEVYADILRRQTTRHRATP